MQMAECRASAVSSPSLVCMMGVVVLLRFLSLSCHKQRTERASERARKPPNKVITSSSIRPPARHRSPSFRRPQLQFRSTSAASYYDKQGIVQTASEGQFNFFINPHIKRSVTGQATICLLIFLDDGRGWL